MGRIIGIDLGTTNTVVAASDDGAMVDVDVTQLVAPWRDRNPSAAAVSALYPRR